MTTKGDGHERQQEPHTIHEPATVVGIRVGKQKAWALPGGRYTTSKLRAEQVAEIIDELRRVNQ